MSNNSSSAGFFGSLGIGALLLKMCTVGDAALLKGCSTFGDDVARVTLTTAEDAARYSGSAVKEIPVFTHTAAEAAGSGGSSLGRSAGREVTEEIVKEGIQQIGSQQSQSKTTPKVRNIDSMKRKHSAYKPGKKRK